MKPLHRALSKISIGKTGESSRRVLVGNDQVEGSNGGTDIVRIGRSTGQDSGVEISRILGRDCLSDGCAGRVAHAYDGLEGPSADSSGANELNKNVRDLDLDEGLNDLDGIWMI